MAAVADGQAAAVVPNMATATSGAAARERSLIVASFLRDRGFRTGSYGRRWLVSVTLASRLRTCIAGMRPVARAAGPRRRRPPPPRTTPTGVWARRYAARGTRFPGRRAYAWGMDVKAVSRFARTFVTDTTNPPAPRPRWLRRGRYDLVEVADVIIALICFAATNSTLTNENASHHGHHSTGVLVLIAFVISAPLALRTRFPLSAWAVSAAALIWTSLVIPPGSLGGPDVPLAGALVYGLCLYAVTVRCRPRIVVAAAAVTVAGAAFIDPVIDCPRPSS